LPPAAARNNSRPGGARSRLVALVPFGATRCDHRRSHREESRTRSGAGKPAREPRSIAQRLRHLLSVGRRRCRGTRERYTSIDIGQNSPGAVFNLFTLSASVNYALDVFGGNRRMIEGLHADLDIAKATEQATYSDARVQYRRYGDCPGRIRRRDRGDAAAHQYAAEQVRLAEIQADAGTVPFSTVLSLRSQLASYEATFRSSNRN
jgi:hypothetical protein